MIDKLQQQIDKLTQQHENHKRWLALLVVLAGMVVAATAHALVRPAITLENTTYCGQTEHTHTEACYTSIATAETAASDQELTCVKEEHTHTLVCYADPTADIENEEDWANSVAQAELTGSWGDDLAAVAQSQLGYAASEKNYTVAQDGETKQPYTRYGAWSGDAYADWNLPFVNFCLHYAQIPAESFPVEADLSSLMEALTDDERNQFAPADGYVPQAGDVALLTNNGEDISAAGIVAELCAETDDQPAKVAVIEADDSNTVRRVEYALDDEKLLGYGVMPENADAEQTSEKACTPKDSQTATFETSNLAAEDEIAVQAASNKTIVGLRAVPKTDTIPAGTKLTQSMFTITATYSDGTTGVIPEPVTVTSPNWPNNYVNNMTEDEYNWTNTFPGVKAVEVTFDANSETESGCDKINLYDGDGTKTKEFSGTEMAGKSYFISGDSVKIAMSSDSSVTEKGFSAVVSTMMQMTPQNAIQEEGNFTVSLELLDADGTPTKISTTAELFSKNGATSGVCGDNARWNYSEDGTLTITGSGALYDYVEGMAFWLSREVQKLIVDDGITSIGANCFKDYENLQTVTIPASVKVNESAFDGCKAITELNVTGTNQQTMKSAPALIVKSCTGDLHVKLADGIALPEKAFDGCTKVHSIKIEGNLSELPSYAFNKCNSMVQVEFPKSVTYIKDYAFGSCKLLEEINIPDGVTYIGSDAFSGCLVLRSIVLPEKITAILGGTFSNCTSLESIVIPDNVKSIANNAFFYCKALQAVTFGTQSKLSRIGWKAFTHCENLTAIELPDSLTEIDDYAFSNTGLKSLTIPQNVEKVGYGFFGNYGEVSELNWNAKNAAWTQYSDAKGKPLTITIGQSVDVLPAQTMKSIAASGATVVRFAGPNWLKISNAAQVDKMLPLGLMPEGDYYVDEAGVLYRLEEDHAVLAYLPAGPTTYTVLGTVPANEEGTQNLPVTTVGSYALNCASKLESLQFQAPEQISALEDFAFAYAGNLSSINDATTAQEVVRKFADDCKTGVLPFTGTKIQGEIGATITGALRLFGLPDKNGNSTLDVTVKTTDSTNYPKPIAADGTKVYYTGEAAVTTLIISNPTSAQIEEDDGAVVRLYMDFDSAVGKSQLAVGDYTIQVNSGTVYTYKVSKIKGRNTYCFEVQRPRNGDTITLNLESGYASPKTAGGKNHIFGAILSKADIENLKENELPAIDQYQNLQWVTKVDTFPVTKEGQNQKLELIGDGEGHAYVKGLTFDIKVAREGDTLEGVGKDLMASIDYTDVLVLPKGVTVSDKVREEIKNGTYTWNVLYWINSWYCTKFYTEDKTEILTLGFNTGTSPKNCKLSINEDGNLVLCWTVENDTLKYNYNPTEMRNTTARVSYGEKTLYIDCPDAETVYEGKNTISVTEHFSYSEDQIKTAESSYSFTCGEGKLTIYKRQKSGSDQMGDGRIYTITAKNPAAVPYSELAYLEDEMPYALYMSADDIAELFDNDRETKQASIRIQNATICEVPEATPVKNMEGKLAGTVSVGNTDTGKDANKYQGMSKGRDPTIITTTAIIEISWSQDETNSDRLSFTLRNSVSNTAPKMASCAVDATEIQKLLDNWGYTVTYYDAKYTVCWDLRDKETGNFTLLGGQEISRDIKVTNKDAFMVLMTDQKYEYPSGVVSGTNYAYGYTAKGTRITYDRSYLNIYREFWLTKGATINGQDVELNPDIFEDGAIIDYSLTVDHDGEAHYDILPLTDHISGSQILLAEVDRNQSADWAEGLETVEENGTAYYKLTAEKTYSGVWLNGWYADSVRVAKSNTGRDTIIKWYFSDYKGTRNDTISYKALLQLTGQESGYYYFHNETWLGDHQTHRLYNEVGWIRLDYTFDKKIVKDETDRGDGVDYCPVTEGQTVTYRLKLQTIHGEICTLTGINLYDELPQSLGADGGFIWRKGDGKIPGTVNIIKYDCPETGNVKNLDHWSVDTNVNDKSTQYIRWDNDFSITFGHEPVYIYVRLTYPKGAEWQEYAKQYSAKILENTFYVEGVPDKVTHALSIPAKAYLQKGVWKTFSTKGTKGSSYGITNHIPMNRWYYCNDDIFTRFVFYYVTIRNDGLTRLYLNDIQDTLPKGFTLEGMADKDRQDYTTIPIPGRQTITTTYDGAFVTQTKADGTKVNYQRANVSVSVEKGKTEDEQKLVFHFTPYTESDYRVVQYDEERDKCYLNPGEAVQFGYYCRTNDSADTEDTATNTAVMPYYDYTGGGLEVGDGQQTALDSGNYTPNDGACTIWDNSTAASNGFTVNSSNQILGDKNATQWMESDVTVYRGGISPGITKKLVAKVNQSGVVTNEPLAAHPVDTLRWKVIAQNNGTLPMIDYTLSDTMPAPYDFTGEVRYSISINGGTTTAGTSVGFFKIQGTKSKDVFEIVYQHQLENSGYGQETVELKVDGKSEQLSVQWDANGEEINTNMEVAMTRDAATQATTLWLHFSDPRMALPEGGVATLTLDTKAPDDTAWRNTVYTNSCNITPMVQPWDTSAVNQGNATTQTPVFDVKERASVRNSAPVTVTYGYATTSLKTVEEVADHTNNANSNSDRSYIVLPGKDSTFRYTLAVTNEDPTGSGQKSSMDELIFIDSLPQQGDHTVFQTDDPRYSDFTVSLADEYKPVVTIKAKDGTTKTLEQSEYKLGFSNQTEFTTADWDGTSTWDTSPTQARSVRLILKDPNAATGTDPLMPSGSTISLSFVCKVDNPNAAAGQIAWNSFGYHYIMHGTNMAQEAAPLKVGVMLPTQPTLQKKLQLNGAPYAAERDETFTFYCYTGQPLTDLPENWTAAQLEAKLTEARRDWRIISVAVTAGDTASAVQQLTDTEKWTWQKNQVYTIVEVPNDRYTLTELNGIQQSAYTFTYDPARALAITATNTHDSWNFTIEKVDEDVQETHLADAWFALYSADVRDEMTKEAYQALSCQPDKTITDGGQTWYLTQVDVTRADTGYLIFAGLTRDEYRLKEIKAPNGYAPDETLHTITREDNAKKICKITNKRAYRLPNTGGCGTTPFTVAGLLLIAAASCLLFKKYRRKQEGGTASSRF